jgi:hypothetical protein
MAVRRGNRTRTHEAQPCRQLRAHGHVSMHGRGTDMQPPRMRSTGAIFIGVTMYRPLYTGHMGGERGTHAHAHALAAARARTRARVHAAADVGTGGPHMRGEIFTSLRSYITLSPEILTDSRSLHACSAPPHTHTHTRTNARAHARAHTRARAHDGGVETDICVHTTWKRYMRVYVGHRKAWM